MDLLNKKALHPSFGEGTVISMEGSHITVRFEEKGVEKMFSYPTVFEKYLTMIDEDAQEFVISQFRELKESIDAERLRKELEFLEENGKKTTTRSSSRKTAVKRTAAGRTRKTTVKAKTTSVKGEESAANEAVTEEA